MKYWIKKYLNDSFIINYTHVQPVMEDITLHSIHSYVVLCNSHFHYSQMLPQCDCASLISVIVSLTSYIKGHITILTILKIHN